MRYAISNEGRARHLRLRRARQVSAVGVTVVGLVLVAGAGAGAHADGSDARVTAGGPQLLTCSAPTEDSFYRDQPAMDTTFGAAHTRPYWRSVAGETSLGALPGTSDVLVQMNLTTARASFAGDSCPTWSDATPQASVFTQDPYLWIDNVTGRTFLTHLDAPSGAATSVVSDDGGRSWTVGETPFEQPALDHQSIATGPYAAPRPLGIRSYPRATYYCAKNDHIKTGSALAVTGPEAPGGHGQNQCERSDDGGLTWGPPVFVNADTIYGVYCNDAAGHVSVSPATGTVFYPIMDCHQHQGVAISRDNGQTWAVSIVGTVHDEFPGPGDTDDDPTGPDTSAYNYGHNFGDSRVAVDASGTVYLSTVDEGHPSVVISHDDGRTWSQPVDVGGPFGIQNAVFPDAVAGDAGRVAVMYYGTSQGGAIEPPYDAAGAPTAWQTTPWYLYLAISTDSGSHWKVRSVTGDDPVQRGCIATYRGDAQYACLNLYDFQDMTIDDQGRVLSLLRRRLRLGGVHGAAGVMAGQHREPGLSGATAGSAAPA
ncbi:MAG: hypothetical protein QOJ79_1028 [Actinomycetota bacterium]|jgi:hypothetical protein|nr:hypothetical protein [Actinomycetota bacterium]